MVIGHWFVRKFSGRFLKVNLGFNVQKPERLGLSHWDHYAMHRGGCLELYYCNIVEWAWWDSSRI